MDKDAIQDVEFEVVVESPNKKKELAVAREALPLEKLDALAEKLANSTMVPMQYQRRPENCFIALDLASRMGVSPMMVMQNLYIIQGKPAWSGSAMGALLRGSGYFRRVEIVYVGTEGEDDWGAYVQAERVSTGKMVKGATVTIKTAKKEGWYQKGQSKWQSMPEIMLGYRAYAWFGRVHAPELLMGLHATDELDDFMDKQNNTATNPFNKKE